MSSDINNSTPVNQEPVIWPLLTCNCKVLGVALLGAKVYEVRLELPSETDDVGFHAGQYLELILDKDLKIPYSIASSPRHHELVLHVMDQGEGSLSDRVLNELRAQPSVQIRMAMGECVLYPGHVNADEELLFIAAGTCFGQMKAMIEHALDEGIANPIHLYWGVREEDQLYLKGLAESWAAEHPQVHFVPVVSDELEGWSGRVGLVHEAVMEDFGSLEKVSAYICGSPQMVYAVEDAFLAHGLRSGSIFSDVFAYAPRPSKDEADS